MSQPEKLKSSAPVTPAQLSSPGLDFASATSSPIDLTGITAGTEMPMTVLDTRAIGARSSALYGRFSCIHGCAMNDEVGDSSRM